MPFASRHRSGRGGARGFTYLELIVVIIIISTLFLFAVDRLLRLRVQAEAARLAYTIGGLEVALSMQMAEMAARGEFHRLPRLAGKNPMDWLQQPPENYAGVVDSVEGLTLEPGKWVFDRRRGELVYRVRYAEYFQPEQGLSTNVRLKVLLVFADKNGNGRFERPPDDLYGVRLQNLTPYRWLEEAKNSG
ncbi:MAG TPA: prepilin-type N-terminal cleavage/methylation domain-containing protein [Gammaproteobacteria bacterium]|nr:prepilin-type N-terminal cleavage/methylation domain-containing protein [Gammaproteobacteria bacterium]